MLGQLVLWFENFPRVARSDRDVTLIQLQNAFEIRHQGGPPPVALELSKSTIESFDDYSSEVPLVHFHVKVRIQQVKLKLCENNTLMNDFGKRLRSGLNIMHSPYFRDRVSWSVWLGASIRN